MPSSHFLQYFPIVIDSLFYGIYSVLFVQAVQVLLSQRRQFYKIHLGCMIVLFLLSTTHIIIAYVWAFTTDTATTAIYEVFSLKNPLPDLYGPDDPIYVHRFAPLIKAQYNIASVIADSILVYRCYVIWGHNWKVLAFPVFALVCTFITSLVGLVLSGTAERAAVAIVVGTTFFTNVLASSLAAGRIWWIGRRASFFLSRGSRQTYKNVIAILLESGLVYPVSLIVTIVAFLAPGPTQSPLICIAALYHIVGIAPTLIIVRVGLGVSTDDVEKCVTTSRGAVHTSALRAAPEVTLELRVRRGTTTEDALEGTFSDTTKAS